MTAVPGDPVERLLQLHRSDGRRSPHKPLLTLLALAGCCPPAAAALRDVRPNKPSLTTCLFRIAKREFSSPPLSARVTTEAEAYLLLEELRWGGTPDSCPHCGPLAGLLSRQLRRGRNVDRWQGQQPPR